MRKSFRILFTLLVTLFLGFFILSNDIYAMINAPEPPVGGMATIRGVVKSPIPVEENIDGKIIQSTQYPLEGVTIAIYECENSSQSCKENGGITNLFGHTTTNVNGEFYIYMTKVDGSYKGDFGSHPGVSDKLWWENIGWKKAESKRRYLAVICGDRFAGLHVIPSYGDWWSMVIEADCPPITTETDMPPTFLRYYDENIIQAPQMGLPDYEPVPEELYPENGGGLEESLYTVQVINTLEPQKTNIVFDLKIEAFDKRFIPYTAAEDMIYKSAQELGHEPAPDQGAFWDLDCELKYPDLPHIRYCLGYGLHKTIAEAMEDLELVESGGNIYAKDLDTGEAIIDAPFEPLFSVSDFQGFWADGKIDRKEKIKIKMAMMYRHPRWLAANYFSLIPPTEELLTYRNALARQDVTQVIKDKYSSSKYNGLHYSNCAQDTFIRHLYEYKDDAYPSCEMYKYCNGVVTITSGTGADAYRNWQTTGGPISHLQSTSDLIDIYNSFADLSTPICVMEEGGQPVTLGQIQPPWDTSNSGYVLDKTYWSNEFLMYKGSLNNVALRWTTAAENANDSFDTSAVNSIMLMAFKEQQPMQLGEGAGQQTGGYAANSSGKAAYQFTVGYGKNQHDYFASPTDNVLTDRKYAAGPAVMSLSGSPALMSEVSNVNPDWEGKTLTPADDMAWWQNLNFGGPPHHHTLDEDILSSLGNAYFNDQDNLGNTTEYAEELSYLQYLPYTIGEGEQLFQLNNETFEWEEVGMTLDEWKEENKELIQIFNSLLNPNASLDREDDGARTATPDDRYTSVAWRRQVTLAGGPPKGINTQGRKWTVYAPLGHDFYDSALNVVQGDGNLTDYMIKPELVKILVDLFKQYSGVEPATSDQSLRDKLVAAVKKFVDIAKGGEFATNPRREKQFLDRTSGILPDPKPLLDYLSVDFPLNEETFFDAFILPNREEGGPEWLDMEDWGENGCYPWNTVPLHGNCITALEDYNDQGVITSAVGNAVSRTCRVDYCLKGTTKVRGECTWNDSIGGAVYISSSAEARSVDITNTPCDSNIDKSKDRLICAQKEYSCLVVNEGGLPEVESGGFRKECKNEEINSTEDCIRCTAYEGEIDEAILELNEKREDYCSKNRADYTEYYYSSGNAIEIFVPIDTTGIDVNTPACLDSAAGPYTCYGNFEDLSTFELDNEILRTTESSIDWAEASVNDLAIETYWSQPPSEDVLDNSSAKKDYISYTVDSTLMRPGERYVYDTAVGKENTSSNVGSSQLIGAGLRSSFGITNKRQFGASLNPVEYHCNNELLGSTGDWDCKIIPEPDPVKIDLNELIYDSSCSLNPTHGCEKLIFATLAKSGSTCNSNDEDETTKYNGGNCQKLKPLLGYGCPTGQTHSDYFDSTCPEETICCVRNDHYSRTKGESIPEFSDTFLQVINSAASQYKIPAAALLAYMYSEGNIPIWAEYFSVSYEDELLQASSPWYGGLKGCDDLASNAQGPYNWLLRWFNSSLNGLEIRADLDSLSMGRGGTASRCNFLDASYVTAASMTEGGTGSCDWDWGAVNKAIARMTYGTDDPEALQESYADNVKAGFGGQVIFDACR